MEPNEIKQLIENTIEDHLGALGNQYYEGQRELMYGHVSHNGWECRNVDTAELAQLIFEAMQKAATLVPH